MDEVSVVTVEGELDVATAARWEYRVEAAGRQSRTVVLDLSSVRFIDSAGVRTLFRWADAARRVGIRLLVAAPREGAVRRLLDILDLEELTPIFDSTDEALQADREPGVPGSRRSSAK
jgi:anti-anti-sigma factor